MLINRIGDIGLALAICAIFLTYKTVDYATVFALTPNALGISFSFLCFDFDRLTLISFLLFWGALGKSAQIGLHI
jgi:NADH:ubiquinone oxidoreductase subunit 5 (subunit L)/multisubunit Na+/H+ antiporter MnhA subunit